MAERNVSVKLTANTTAYVAGLKAAENATTQLGNTGTTNFTKLGGQMHDVGRKMTVGVTLPIVGAGTAAVKLSNDFNTAFGQMVGLAGVPAREVDKLKESVLDLAGETAQAPQELAEALYFAASAGLDSAQAMEAVTIAARASAAGMGSTKDVVGLAASAVASYGAANITSAEAVDILTSTIREGRAEPAELASSLGRILPIAASMDVGLAEVGGTVAYLSNIFGDTDRTVTAVNDAFAKLAAPTDGAREALSAAGTSADELHRTISEDGLLAGLELLREHGFKGNAAAIRELMPDMQGAAALTALLDDASGSLATTLGAVEDSTGSLDTAYGAIDKNAQKMKQSWVDIQVALIQVGEVIGPIVADIAGGIGDLASAFAGLDPTIQKIVLAITGAAAAAGPLLMVTGSLIRNYTTLSEAMVKYNATAVGQKVSAGVLAGVLGGIGIALSAATIAYGIYADKKAEATRRTNDFVSALEAESAGQADAVNALLARNLADLADEFEAVGIKAVDAARYIKGEHVPAVQALIDNYDPLKHSMDDNAGAMHKVTGTLTEQRSAYEAANDVYVATKTVLDDLSTSTNEAEEAARQHADGLRANAREASYNADANDEMGRIQQITTAAVEAATAAQDAFMQSIKFTRDEVGSLKREIDDQQAWIALQDTFDATTEKMNDTEAATREVESAVLSLKEEVLLYAESINLPERVTTNLVAMIDQGKADEVRALLAQWGNGITLPIKPYIINTGTGTSVRIDENGNLRATARAAGGPTSPGHLYEVAEGGKSELLYENGRSYLLAAQSGYVVPFAASAGQSSAPQQAGPITGVHVETLIDNSGESLDNMYRAANAYFAMAR